MSLLHSDRVDYLGLEKKTGKIIATIADDLDWTDELNHLALLQTKINNYLNFIENGEIYEEVSNIANRKVASGAPVVINVIAKFDPSEEGKRFFEQAARVAKENGVEFSLEILKSS